MIVWTAQCPTCGVRQRVPDDKRDIKQAKAWAALWQKQHDLEVHHDDTDETASEEGA